jgi:hypothetical protein
MKATKHQEKEYKVQGMMYLKFQKISLEVPKTHIQCLLRFSKRTLRICSLSKQIRSSLLANH